MSAYSWASLMLGLLLGIVIHRSMRAINKNILKIENEIKNVRAFFPADGEPLDPCPSEKNSRPVPDESESWVYNAINDACPCEWAWSGSAPVRLVKRSEECEKHGPQHGMPARYLTDCGGCGEPVDAPAPPGCARHELAQWQFDAVAGEWFFRTSDRKAPVIIRSAPQE